MIVWLKRWFANVKIQCRKNWIIAHRMKKYAQKYLIMTVLQASKTSMKIEVIPFLQISRNE